MFSLKDKVALVTGGGSGIGLATARRFASAGAKVVIANRPEEVAALIHFLAADDCRYITGQAVMIDGGLLNIHAHALVETVIAAKGRS
jgi:NAD(P)-dependent dehydrogenase (short-subunit alcohol dehydrogenase family)